MDDDWVKVLVAQEPATHLAGSAGQELPAQSLTVPDAQASLEAYPEVSSESVDDLATYLTVAEGTKLVQSYFLTGNLAESARRVGVRYAVALRTSKEQWWEEELASLERQAKIQQKTRLAALIDKTFTQLENRIEHGDTVIVRGEEFIVPVKAHDLAAIAAILSEKRDKLDADTKPLAGGPKGKLETLADQLRAKAAANASDAVAVKLKQVGNGS